MRHAEYANRHAWHEDGGADRRHGRSWRRAGPHPPAQRRDGLLPGAAASGKPRSGGCSNGAARFCYCIGRQQLHWASAAWVMQRGRQEEQGDVGPRAASAGMFQRRSGGVSAPEYGRKCPQGVVDGLRIWKNIEEIRCDDDHVGTLCVARRCDAPDGVGEVVLRTHGVLVLGGCASCLAHTVSFVPRRRMRGGRSAWLTNSSRPVDDLPRPRWRSSQRSDLDLASTWPADRRTQWLLH